MRVWAVLPALWALAQMWVSHIFAHNVLSSTFLNALPACGRRIFEIIDMEPDICEEAGEEELAAKDGLVRGAAALHLDGCSSEGGEHQQITVELGDVDFTYQIRPDSKVLKGAGLLLPAGKITAVVGKSGCGKTSSPR